ncbi:hypothetical protein B0H16DRAFT_1460275 [Mycena metata]|uniref:Uncharacterized protein n=1 Tax=Mycena metata TaxID=1033252 RepID=A0AAD7IVH5_9AGAR|nr:hypothetical protein B0H16DRAFT_1460275 [Mycena metata]
MSKAAAANINMETLQSLLTDTNEPLRPFTPTPPFTAPMIFAPNSGATARRPNTQRIQMLQRNPDGLDDLCPPNATDMTTCFVRSNVLKAKAERQLIAKNYVGAQTMYIQAASEMISAPLPSSGDVRWDIYGGIGRGWNAEHLQLTRVRGQESNYRVEFADGCTTINRTRAIGGRLYRGRRDVEGGAELQTDEAYAPGPGSNPSGLSDCEQNCNSKIFKCWVKPVKRTELSWALGVFSPGSWILPHRLIKKPSDDGGGKEKYGPARVMGYALLNSIIARVREIGGFRKWVNGVEVQVHLELGARHQYCSLRVLNPEAVLQSKRQEE